MSQITSEQRATGLADQVAERLRTRGSTIAVAESVTGGLLVNHLARADGAGQWLRGGVVAYASEVSTTCSRCGRGRS
ncbi:CinA family protein [Iamia sp.]|uniref:CinA family protein n=1 Tax=Iamia sp. TaxID=2722710 RepID=UPI002C9FB379|nr:CinA family protein [Iamia sp.]HXH57663.1 CinA family protein [Iamia sp.]